MDSSYLVSVQAGGGVVMVWFTASSGFIFSTEIFQTY